MTRKVLKYKDFKPVTKFLQKFNLKSFVNKKKIEAYMNFFELNYLLREIPEDRLKNKNKKFLIQVKGDEKREDQESLAKRKKKKREQEQADENKTDSSFIDIIA